MPDRRNLSDSAGHPFCASPFLITDEDPIHVEGIAFACQLPAGHQGSHWAKGTGENWQTSEARTFEIRWSEK